MDRAALARLRLYAGYLLFAGTVIWGVWHAPPELWALDLPWLLLAAAMALLVFLLQALHVALFLRYHRLPPDWPCIALFTARKGLLNTILPAKSGTLVLLRTLTRRYPELRWHDYLRYMLLGVVVSLMVSLLAALGLVLDPLPFTLACLFVTAVLVLLSRLETAYLGCLPALALIATGLYLVILCSIWAVLRGLGHALDFPQASQLGITLNTLAQISITPGNLGARELLLGLVGRGLELPVSVGILAGAIFFTIRVLVFGLLLAATEWLVSRSGSGRTGPG
ncbi:MAG: hypothetical protein D6786_07755 [Gammaproteobacteria bacterium]|nr:MAG: hypothetical protein D6786_07755 [Gammaproteobacteria bacterium]